MQRLAVFLLIVLIICQWGYAEPIPPTSLPENGPASTEATENFVARSLLDRPNPHLLFIGDVSDDLSGIYPDRVQ